MRYTLITTGTKNRGRPLAAILLSLCGCGAITARDPHWRDNYEPPYMGVKHAFYSVEKKDPFAGILLLDLPATFVVDTCLLPWDLVTIISGGE